MDLSVLIVCTVALIKMFESWKECYFDFDAWAICIVIFSLFSLVLNFGTAYYLINGQKL